jgi:hypothetical protein
MAVRAISRQGVSVTYVKVTSTYNVTTGSATSVEARTTTKAYPKHLVANHYNHPNLVGKSVKEFYFVGSALASAPNPADKIVQGSDTYSVVSYREHVALGEVCLYCVIATKQ